MAVAPLRWPQPRSGTIHYYLSWSVSKIFASCSYDLKLCCSKGRNASTGRHNSDSTELGDLLPPDILGPSHLWIKRQRRELLCWPGWLILITQGNWTPAPQWKRGRSMSGIQEIPWGGGGLLVLLCPVIKVNGNYIDYNNPIQADPSRNEFSGHPTRWRTTTHWGVCWGQREQGTASERRNSTSRLQHRHLASVFSVLACPEDSRLRITISAHPNFQPAGLPYKFQNCQSLQSGEPVP